MVAPVILLRFFGLQQFFSFAASAGSRPSAWCFLLVVVSVVLLRFSGLSLLFGFTATASFCFLLAGVSCRLKGAPQQVGSLLFRAAVGFAVVVILAVRWSLTSRITSPPLAAGRPLRGRPCALALANPFVEFFK